MTLYIKQYGYFRTGTNFLRDSLERNFECKVLVNVFGHKHAVPCNWRQWLSTQGPAKLEKLRKESGETPRIKDLEANFNNIHVVTIIKDPYGWLDSFTLYRKRLLDLNGRKWFLSYLREEILQYNYVYRAWCTVPNHLGLSRFLVRYEDMLRDYGACLHHLGKWLQTTPKHKKFQRVRKRVDPHAKLRGQPFDPDYFLSRKYMENLPPEYKELVTKYADWGFFSHYGYHRATAN